MAEVVRMEEWRRQRGNQPGEDRLSVAVERLDRLLAERGWDRQPAPSWLLTDLLAIQGCIAMGLTQEAAQRLERLIERSERRVRKG
jgi:hypothetical protein